MVRVREGSSSLKLALKSENGQAFPDTWLLAHLPPGTYDFWPYRSEAEGRMLYDTGWAMAAPI